MASLTSATFSQFCSRAKALWLGGSMTRGGRKTLKGLPSGRALICGLWFLSPLACKAKIETEIRRPAAAPKSNIVPSADPTSSAPTSGTTPVSAGGRDPTSTLFVVLVASLPACTETNEGQLAYVKESDTFQACSAGRWTVIEIRSASSDRILTTQVPPGADCPGGGVRIDAGRDNGMGSGSVSGDGILQSGEIQSTRYVCNGKGDVGPSGFSALVASVVEGPGAQCVHGGIKVLMGVDHGGGTGGVARDGVLQPGEISESRFLCNGADGIDGASGFNSLIATAIETAGANCAQGGTKISVGLDSGAGGGIARDAVLQAGEATETRFICNGATGSVGATGPGGMAALLATTVEPAGGNCAGGGVKVTSGLDDGLPSGASGDGILQAGEIDQTRFVCHGAPGTDGTNGSHGFTSLLVTEVEAPSANCAGGGLKISNGLDNGASGGTASDNILQAGEVSAIRFLCNGATGATGATGSAGYTSLIASALESPGASCASGGFKISMGLDNGGGSGSTARDGTLQAGEITETRYVCNGANGANGTNGSDGFNSLLATASESAGGNCPSGGTKITIGLDNGNGGGTARDGVLHPGEVSETRYACHGAGGTDGYTSLVATASEPAGANCSVGGIKITAGVDNGSGSGTARDGILQSGEIRETRYLCQTPSSGGSSGFLILTYDESAGSNCTHGGSKLVSGYDNGNGAGGIASDGLLQAGEITQTRYVCNGSGAFKSLLATTSEAAGANCASGGVKIQVGLDNGLGSGTANDNSLQAGEVTQTNYVCNGASGTSGQVTLMASTSEASGANCSNGGLKISYGLDDGTPSGIAGNRVLEAGEVDENRYICNGSAVTASPPATGLTWLDASPLASRTIRPSWTPSTLMTATSQSLTVYSDSACTTAVGGVNAVNLGVSTTTVSLTVPSDGEYWFKVLTASPDGALTSACSPTSMRSDMTAPVPATDLTWGVAMITSATNVTASWTKSTSTDVQSQELRVYSDSACTTSVSSYTGLSASATTQAVAVSSPRSFLYFKVLTTDQAGNVSSSACNPTRLVSDLNAPPTLASVDWAEATTTTTRVMTASWTATSDPFVASLEVQLYSDASCTTTSGSAITGIAKSTTSLTVTLPDTTGSYRFKVFTVDLGGDKTGSVCSSARSVVSAVLRPGLDHTCALKSNGTIFCWGDNTYGQLGNGTTTFSAAPVQVTGISSGVSLASGSHHSCAVLADGTVRCWGRDNLGQLGNGATLANSSLPSPVYGITNAVTIDSYSIRTCALLQDATVSCWGGVKQGTHVGFVDAAGPGTPVPVQLSGVQKIATGDGFSCAIVAGGEVRCWGEINSSRQLGTLVNTGLSGMQTVVFGTGTTVTGVRDIELGKTAACVVTTSGALYCWGWPLPAGFESPSFVGSFGSASSLALGDDFGCVLAGGKVLCWGAGLRLGGAFSPSASSEGTSASTMREVPGLSQLVSIAAGPKGTFATDTTGVSYAWGYENNFAQLGYGTRALVAVTSGVTAASAGGGSSCAVISNILKCWGDNSYRQLGLDISWHPIVPTPVPITLAGTPTQVTSGREHTCGVIGGGLQCWGDNYSGQLGNGETGVGGNPNTRQPVPQTVYAASSGVTRAAAGYRFSCGIVAGAARCWGYGGDGQIGNSTWNSYTTPQSVSGLGNNVTAIAAGYGHACAIRSGELLCWGGNNNYQLGTGNTSNYSTPTSRGTTWTSVATGYDHTCGVNNGGVQCWGGNSFGQSGQSSGATTSTATWVSGLGANSNVTQVVAGGYHSCALLSNGTVRCWGYNNLRQLGDGTTTNSHTPVTVVGITTAQELYSGWGSDHTCARLSDGSLRCWGGDNTYGQSGIMPYAISNF